MKKLLSIILSCAMLCLCGTASAQEYSATADGFGGPVTVTLTVEDGMITAVSAVGEKESSPAIGTDLSGLAEQILAAQGTEIDGVAGATVTGNAVISAAKAALAQAEGTESTWTAGTYTESAMGRNAAVTVEVVLGEGTIESVKVVAHDETLAVATVALERIPAAIVAGQTTKVDAVTGATVTTNAIKSAVNAAIEEAGGMSASLPEVHAEPKADIEDSADIIIVGGGGAGMAAAISATQNDASVILVEKTSMLGGNTVLCGGALNAADTEWAAQFDTQTGEVATLEQFATTDESKIPAEYMVDFHTLQAQIAEYVAGDTSKHFDSVELHTIQTLIHGTRADLNGEVITGNYDLVSTMTRNAMNVVNWLGDLGIQWQPVVTQPVGAMWRRGHNPSMMHGEEYVAVLGSKITADGGKVMLETAAKNLITDETGKVVGVEAVQADGTKVTLHAAKAVILTTGGYANNLAMVQEYDNYWPEIPNNTGSTNASGLTGDGIIMAKAVGAGTTGMEFTQMMAVSDPDTGDLFTGLLPSSTADYIMINTNGERFVNECSARDTLSIAALENGGLFYMLADIDIAEDARWLSNWETEVDRGNTIMADTLDELADKLGFEGDTKTAFLTTIEKYNSYVDAGVDADFQKNALNEKVDNGPFFASPRKPALHHTMGGLTINTSAQVLSTDGEVIPGLFAAGEVCGGIHAGNRLGGNAVADCFVFGKIAGEAAAK